MDKWIRWISKLRYVIVASWISLALLAFLLLPELQSVVRATEQKFLPPQAESLQASQLLQEINPDAKSLSNAVLVLTRNEGLGVADRAWMNQLLREIDHNQAEYPIASILSSDSQPELSERLYSSDGTTLLAIFNLPEAEFENQTQVTLNKLRKLMEHAPDGATATLTGSAPLSQDFQHTSQVGLRRTELLTIGIVLIILLLVFRSPITPIIPLLTIGLSLVLTRGILALAAAYGLPISHFTESFLIAVLFGAGTDYCILIIQRYREELTQEEDFNPLSALSRAMSGVGSTLIYSASTVMVAFLLMGFTHFGLYKSAVGVAIGVIITGIASITLVPALLLLFGRAAIWPHHPSKLKNKGDSRRLKSLSLLTAKRSGLILIAVSLILAPLTLLYKGQRSFDDISEINEAAGSSIGFHQMEKAFRVGELFPVTFAVTTTHSMRTTAGLAALEQASSELSRYEGVAEVRSAVRPLGQAQDQFSIRKKDGIEIGALIRAMSNQQQSLLDSLRTIVLGAIPLSQGLYGMWPAILHLGDGFQELISSQLKGFRALPHNQDTEAITEGQQALEYYMSPDGLITKFEIILEMNPYSTDALDLMLPLTEKLRTALNATALTDPEAFATGVTAKYSELRDLSYVDFLRTGIFIFVSMTLILMLMLRSILTPLCVMLSLGFNYFITMGMTEFLFVRILGFEGLSWTVSFFVFVVVVALGVDYSLFLMGRFKEEALSSRTAPAMMRTIRTTGSTIISAAVIMAGTFGALSFSGVPTLVQIGVGAFIGLTLFAALFILFIIPAFTFQLGERVWWPRTVNKVTDKEKEQNQSL